ncbi:hypothetical protein M8J76_005730 [Diaphorina citri]|nr:hypothetical protein M8J75_012669 [Diaphorina citri]KAI5749228.1 hypothetical protein M8J76_005730 [Diaphorina citri]KAI5754338.1 hypothetical protein M8J77_007892 [Diaphorina citri]
MESGVTSDISLLFRVSRLIGITPYTLPAFSLSYPIIAMSTILILTLTLNLSGFLLAKVNVYVIDFVSQNFILVNVTSYAVLAIIQSVRGRAKVAKIFNKLNKMDVQLKCIGVEVPSYKRLVRMKLVYLGIILVMHQGPDLLIWLTDQYVYHPSYFIAVIYCQAIRLLSEFQFVTYLHLASNRFDIINARMKSYGVSKLLFVRDFKHPAYDNAYDDTLQIKLLLRVHNALCRVSHLTSDVFAVQILLSVASCFAYLTSNLYYLSITLLNVYQIEESNRGYRKLVFLLFCSYWIVSMFLELLFIVKACERPVKAAQKTAEICHDIQVKERLPHLHTELQAYSDLLEYQKISLTCCGLFPLDSTLIYSIIGGAATYCVIIIQFGVH